MSRARFGWVGRGSRVERRFRGGFRSVPEFQQPPVTTNLYAWYDASAVNGLFAANPTTDGSAVSSWKDLSGNGRDLLQATAASQPLFRNASRNLLTFNQGATCEDGTTTGFSVINNCTLAASTTVSSYGNYALAITTTSAGVNAQAGTSTGLSGIPVTTGSTYTGFVSARAATTVRSWFARIVWYDSSGTGLSSSSGTSSNNSTSAWTDYSVTGIAPANAAYAAITLRTDSAGAAEVHYADKFGLFNGTVISWVPPVTLINNQPTVQFDGSNDSLASGTTYQNGVPYSIYVVAGRDGIATGSTDQYFWSLRDGGKNGLRGIMQSPTTTTGAYRTDIVATSGTPTSQNTGATSLNTSYVLTSIVSGTGFQLSNILSALNGTATSASSTALLTSASSQIYVGGLGTAGTLSGRISAVLIYSAAHDTTTRQSIERWLGAKYGITVA